MQQQISLELVRKFDHSALSPLTKDRAAYHLLKRSLDLTLVISTLVLLAPIMIVIAVLIVLDSGWPPIYTQERVGAKRWVRRGFSYWQRTTFTIYKFRSMYQDADEILHQSHIKKFANKKIDLKNANIQFKARDPRVTRVGRFLRQTSLDELPQLVNVLKGDMSLVGPRPHVLYEVDEYESWHHERLAALPGITGWWQINGRCETSFKDSIQMDIEYVRNQSLWLDIRILLRTFPAVISRQGAG